MAINRWLTTCAGLVALLLGLGQAAVARAAEVLQVRAALHQSHARQPSQDTGAAQVPAHSRIVFDLAALRPGAAEQVRVEPVPAGTGSAWAVFLDMPLSARAAAQIRALPDRLPGVVFDLKQTGTAASSVLTLRFERPTVLARHFVLPGRRGQQERLVLDFIPAASPAALVAAHELSAQELSAQELPAQGLPISAIGRVAVAGAGGVIEGRDSRHDSHLPDPHRNTPALALLANEQAEQTQEAQAQEAQTQEAQAQASQPRQEAGQPGRGEPGTVQGTEPGAFDTAPAAPAPEAQTGPDGPKLPRSQMEPADAMPLQGPGDALPPPPGGGSPLTLWGFFEAEGRWFPQDSRDGAPDHLIGSMAMEPTIEYSWQGGSQFLRVTGFARVDTVTENRTHADVREAKYVGVFGPLELTVGVDRRFWGVTEAVHLVNIINQVDTLEDVDFEDYLGQPLVSAAYTTRYGTFSAFLMPYFRERLFPIGEDRPNLPVKVNRTLTQYDSGDNNWHPDWAVRWSLREGPVDLGLSYFSGFSREPQLLLALDALGQPQLIPRYNVIDQVGVDLQATLGAWLLKFEGIHRWDPVEDYAAFAAGFEYTLYGVSSAGADLGLLAEYLYDERGKGTRPVPGFPPFSNVSPYDDDLFVGLRWSGNDINSTELLGGAIVDLDTKSKAFVVEASRRLGQNLRISLDGRFFTSVSTRDVLWPLGDDDFIQLKIQWHY